jgi:protein TonB
MLAAIAALALAQAVSGATPQAPAVVPLPDNKPCAYPEAARKASVTGAVAYVARITPKGTVDSVEILTVPLPDLGFEDAVRSCVSAWRFEAAPTGEPDLRLSEGRVRFALAPDAEAEVRNLLSELATAWNGGKKGALEELEAGHPFLGKQLGAIRGADECRLELEPASGYVRFIAPDLAEARQSFACLAPRANAKVPARLTLDLMVGKGARGWRFVDVKEPDKVWFSTLRVGRGVPEPRILSRVPAAYPDAAKEARVQGVVILDCLVSPEGRVTAVRVVHGIPLLDEAAVNAVRQWAFAPTVVDGKPAPVVVTVQVNFTLP